MTRFAIAAAIAASLFVARTADACPGCSNPNLPSARGGSGSLRPGEVSLSFNVTGMMMTVVHSEYCPEIGPICKVRPEPPQLHDQQVYVAELRTIAAVGITKIFAAELQLPLRLVHTAITFRRLDGTAFVPDYENIHHRNETLFGFADPWVLGRASGTFGRFSITTRAGFAVPLGKVEEDPFARAEAGLPHQHVQFGTGTVHPIFAVDMGVTAGPARIGGYAQALLFPYENWFGYRAGSRYAGGLSVDVEVYSKLRLGATADLLHEEPERWGGVVQQEGNVGRTDLLVGGSISYVVRGVQLGASVKGLAWQELAKPPGDDPDHPTQFTYPVVVNLSVGTSFGGASPVRPRSGVLPEK